MNQEQNNFNQNNSNMQGNNGIPNNQPLGNFNSGTNINQPVFDNQQIQNNVNFNNGFNQGVQQDININQSTFNSQSISSYQQSINQTNMQETVQQPLNNAFESGNGNSFNSKSTKKMKLGLIIGIIAAVVVVGVGIVFAIKLFSNSIKNSSGNNLNNNSQSNSTVKDNYKKISLDKIGEFNNNGYFVREQMTPIAINYIGKINFGSGNFYQTLDFTNSDLKPMKFEYDSFKLGGNTSMGLHYGNGLSIYSNYQQLDTTEYENIIEGFNLNLFYQPDIETSYYHLIASKDEYYWSINSSFKENPTYSSYSKEEAKENIKKMLKLIQLEYDKTAPTAVEFISKIPTTIDFSFVSFDFNHEDIKINTYTAKFSNEQGYQLYNIELGQDISYKNGSLVLGVSYVENIANSISTADVKLSTKILYELNINNKNIRVYINQNNNLAYLGFIHGQNEYIIPATTKDLTVDEIFELLNLIIQ